MAIQWIFSESIFMSETNQPIFQIQRIYLKDLSIEQPNSPAIFLEQDPPSIDMTVNVHAQGIIEHVYEVAVMVTLTAKIKDKVAFLVEGKQAGIFTIQNMPESQLQPLLGIGCPNILFPYLRANLADAVTRAGFPPVHLSEINFEYLFNKQTEEASSSIATTTEPSTTLH